MKKCVIIYNPASGKKKKDHNNIQVFYDILRKHGYETEIIFTSKQKGATEIIKELDPVDLVISAGGDGTLNEVVTGNLQRKERLTLANLPMGTVNDVANMYGYTKNNYIKNLELLLEGVKKNIDVCFIDKTPFVYVACLGDYIDMAYNTPRKLKKKYGKIGYVIYGLKQLRNKINSYNVRYKIDGETYEGKYSFFFITNASRVAGFDDVYYDIKLDDNKFEVAFCHVKSRVELMKYFILLNNMDAKDVPGITYYQTDNLEIEFLDSPKVSWCIDGEEYKSTKKVFKFSVDKETKMMLPKKNLVKLYKK